MVELHAHTVFSDGELLPTELARRYEAKNIKGLVLSDHVDYSNIDFVVPRLVKVCQQINATTTKIRVLPGAEITHAQPSQIKVLVKQARELGAKVVIVHGETLVEPVIQGTNRAAVEAGADILAHPGLITEEDAKVARKKGVRLEISGRKGHSLTNGHVAKVARKVRAKLVFGTDSHGPDDIYDEIQAEEVARGAGLELDEVKELFLEGERLFNGYRDAARR